MKELSIGHFDTIAPMFRVYEHHGPIFGAVLEGRKSGYAFTDEAGETVFLVAPGGWGYFVGKPGNPGFMREATDFLIGLVPAEAEEAVIYAPSDAFRADLDQVLSVRKAIRIHRKTFRFALDAFRAVEAWLEPLPTGVSIMVDGTPSGDFGVRLLHDGNTVSECRSVFVGHGQVETFVQTDGSRRRQGLAFAASVAFIAECLKRGLTPCWGCWPYNEASERLAVKLGFIATGDMPAHFWEPGMSSAG